MDSPSILQTLPGTGANSLPKISNHLVTRLASCFPPVQSVVGTTRSIAPTSPVSTTSPSSKAADLATSSTTRSSTRTSQTPSCFTKNRSNLPSFVRDPLTTLEDHLTVFIQREMNDPSLRVQFSPEMS